MATIHRVQDFFSATNTSSLKKKVTMLGHRYNNCFQAHSNYVAMIQLNISIKTCESTESAITLLIQNMNISDPIAVARSPIA